VLQVHRAAKVAREAREALRLKELEGIYLLIKFSSDHLYFLWCKRFFAEALSSLPEPYIPKNDPKLKDVLAELEVIHKIIDKVVDEALNDIAERVLKGNWQTFM
jgi:hypothetical protein